MRPVPAVLAALATACAAAARPQESVVFNPVTSNGTINSPANTLLNHTFVGGFPLGRVDFSGTLTSLHALTWRTDSRILVTAPGGQTQVIQPFTTGTIFTTLPFSGSIVIAPGTDPVGPWSFRFYEAVDNGGTQSPDARWDVTITLTDQPPPPPAATNLGAVAAPGASVPSIPVANSVIHWYRLDLADPVSPSLNSWLDIDTVGSSLPAGSQSGLVPDDTELALYDAAGALIATDDDSGPGGTSQLTFGAGTRPPVGNGQPYDGRHGPLAPGTYYLAVGAYNINFGPLYWAAHSTSDRNGTATINIRTNLGDACYPDCTGNGQLTVADFGCFQTRFVIGDPYADCSGDGVLTVADFGCFQTQFVVGCP